MKEVIYITGHRNPDTDSIVSAIAYADLKNKRGAYHAIPVRLGELNQETRFLLDKFEVEPPKLIDTMKPQVKDFQYDPPYPIAPTTTMYKALTLLQNDHLPNLNVVDDKETLLGVVSFSNLTLGYMDLWDNRILGRAETPLMNILEVLRGEILYSPDPPRAFSGRMTVFAMEPESVGSHIAEDDIVIVGNRENAQGEAIKRRVSLLILTVDATLSSEHLELAQQNEVTVIRTSMDTFLAARLLPLAVPVSYVMSQQDLVTFQENDTIDELRNVMGQTRYRSYPVINQKNQVLGSIARYHLIATPKKKIILVDHNERNQSVPDLDSAEIIEIIDHHRVANINTPQPIYFRNVPVGSTATIISMMYFEQGVHPKRQIAGLLCGAIISDTLMLKSPTTTDDDRRMLRRMAQVADLDIPSFAQEMFQAGTSLEGKDAKTLLSEDVKEFEIDGELVRVAQVFTMNLDDLESHKTELIAQMQEDLLLDGLSSYLLVFTDVLKEMSHILVVGAFDAEIARAFGSSLDKHGFDAVGVLSRKKQVIPVTTQAILTAKA